MKEKAGLATLVEGVGMLTRILQVKNDQDLKKILAKNEIIDTLMEVLENCKLDPDSKRTLLPVVVNRIRQVFFLVAFTRSSKCKRRCKNAHFRYSITKTESCLNFGPGND